MRTAFLGLASFASVLCVCMVALGADAPLAWKLDPALEKKLASAVTAGDFQLRLPQGYRAQDVGQGPPGAVVTRQWAAPPATDGSQAILLLTVIRVPPDEPAHPSSEVLDILLAQVEKRAKDWKRTPAEIGLVNGIPFARASWTGVHPTSGKKRRGFMYVALVDGLLVQVSGFEVVPLNDGSMKLLDASALTLRKK